MTLNNFYKYRLSEFNKISLIDSEFDMIEKGYKDFIHLMDVDAEPENINHKLFVPNSVFDLYDKLIREHKQVSETESTDNKSNSWKQKYDPKNLKALDYQPVWLEIQKNLKMKFGNFCVLFTDKKNLQNNSTKVRLTLLKNGNNFYEQQK